MEQDKVKTAIDFSEAEALLSEAKRYLNKGKTLKALRVSRKALASVHKARKSHSRALGHISQAQLKIAEARKRGVDTTQAEDFLAQAQAALANYQYLEVFTFAKQSALAVDLADFVPGRDISIKTTMDFKEGRTTYEIVLENNTDTHIQRLKILPDLLDTPFQQEEERVVSLKPRKEERVMFDLQFQDIRADAIIPGKDVTIQSTLRPGTEEGKIVYSVWMKNNTAQPISGLRIFPRLPDVLIPDSKEKVIELLNPQETKLVAFEVHIRGVRQVEDITEGRMVQPMYRVFTPIYIEGSKGGSR